MARGINKVIVVGNLGQDPETRYTGSGTAITTVSIATSEAWTDKQTGEKQERTEWHRVKLFGKLAEVAGEYLKKGRQVYIEGSLRTDKYTDKDGIERYATSIITNEMQMLGGQPSDRPADRYGESRHGSGQPARGQRRGEQRGSDEPSTYGRRDPQSAANWGGSPPPPSDEGAPLDDDDIPF